MRMFAVRMFRVVPLSPFPTGAFVMTQTLLPHLAHGASIIHISSTRALQSEAHTEAYAAAKAGLLGLTHAQVCRTVMWALGRILAVHARVGMWGGDVPW